VKGIKKVCRENGDPTFVGLEQMTASFAQHQQLEAAQESRRTMFTRSPIFMTFLELLQPDASGHSLMLQDIA
jgi:hypothetical protein